MPDLARRSTTVYAGRRRRGAEINASATAAASGRLPGSSLADEQTRGPAWVPVFVASQRAMRRAEVASGHFEYRDRGGITVRVDTNMRIARNGILGRQQLARAFEAIV